MTGLLHDQLPVVLAGDPMIARFVALVDGTASELYERVGTKDVLFDSATAPDAIVGWLADLLSIRLPADVPEAQRRAVVMAAAASFPRRGTVDALRAVLGALVGGGPEAVVIEDWGDVHVNGTPSPPPERGDAAGSATLSPPSPSVKVRVRSVRPTSRADVEALIERELRADVALKLDLNPESVSSGDLEESR